MKRFLIINICLILLLPGLFASEPFDLTGEDLAELQAGKMLTHTRKIPKAPWPELTFYTLIDASPTECAAVLSYYPHQTRYAPGMVIADPLKHITPTDVHMFFKMDMPWPAPDTETVTGNRLSRPGENDFLVEWYLVKSDSSKESRGSARFLAYENKTLYRYRSFNHPTSSLAKLVKGKMIKSTRKSVEAFVAYVETVKKTKPKLMAQYLDTLTRALNGENVYQALIKN